MAYRAKWFVDNTTPGLVNQIDKWFQQFPDIGIFDISYSHDEVGSEIKFMAIIVYSHHISASV